MRTIRFRAWHKQKKEMLEGSLDYWFSAIASSGKNPFKHCEWLEYTGLKDSKGKEIFEGDIVIARIPQVPSVKRDPEYVYWNKEATSFYLNNPKYKGGWGNSFTSVNHEYEVIGNIYENKELLK